MIVKSERCCRTIPKQWIDPVTVPGLLLTMRDGTRWFHPYDGSKPVKETA